MLSDFRVQVHGLREVEAVLKRLPDATAKRVIRNGLRAGGRIWLKEARRILDSKVASGRSGDRKALRNSGTVRVRKASLTSTLLLAGFKAPHAHLVEFGTGERVHTSTGKSVGRMPAQPFGRPAYDAKRHEIVQAIGKSWGRGIEREAAKLAGVHRGGRGRSRRAA